MRIVLLAAYHGGIPGRSANPAAIPMGTASTGSLLASMQPDGRLNALPRLVEAEVWSWLFEAFDH